MKMTEIVLVVATLVAWSVNAHAETSELKELQGIAIIAGALLVCSQDSAFSAEARQSFGALTAEFESRISEYLKQQYKQVALKDASSRDRAAEVSEIDKRAEKLTLFQAEGARGIQKNEITCMQAAGSALKR